jgi:hypothetical protein
MDFIFGNLELLKVFAISLIHLDLEKTEANKEELIIGLFYHIYNVHQSNKCFVANFLCPNSKKIFDELLLNLMETDDELVIDITSKLLDKIYNELYDREIDAIDVACKIFVDLNKYAKIQQDLEDKERTNIFLTTEEILEFSNLDKLSIIYKCINNQIRKTYFRKKKIREEYKSKINQIIIELEIKCPIPIYEKISKKKKYEPLIHQMRKKYADDFILALGNQKERMELILGFIQKLYL